MRLPAPIRRITEAVRERIVAPVREQLGIERNNAALLAESVSDLERQLHDPEWIRFTALAEQEFSPEGMQQLRAICRLFAIKNPLIKRGLGFRAAYVWGQGVEIAARANGKQAGEQDVQAVVQAFLDDPGNQRAFTGAEARVQLEHALGTEGEVFVAMWTRPTTGQVQVRTVPADEIIEIICNPQDRTEPWFYRRRWVETSYSSNGGLLQETKERMYPCVDYRPRTRPRQFATVPVDWNSPIVHVAVNRPLGWQRGVPDAYAAIDWARAFKTFLEDWATVVKSLSRFAWRLTSKGSARSQVRQRLAAAPPRDPATGEAQDAGATAVTPMDAVMEAIPKSGATIDAESGRPLAMMVASALDVPVTALLSDPGQTGARATAETLNKPTEMAMQQRQQVWATALQRILAYVILQAVRAPQGPLAGRIVRDNFYSRETVELDGGTSTVIDITWPDLDDVDPVQLVEAIVKANSTQTVPPEQVARLLLTALGVQHVDQLVDSMIDDITGEFRWPNTPLGQGQAAAAQLRTGGDPAAAGPGPMGAGSDGDGAGDGDDPPEE